MPAPTRTAAPGAVAPGTVAPGTAAPRRTALLPWAALAALVHRTAVTSGAAVPGGTLVVAVDGYSGAGKTWLADRLARALGADLLHVDDYVPGWDALDAGVRALGRDLVGPWARGEPGRARRYDWVVGAAEPATALPPPALAVLEGSGVASLGPGSGLAARVWVHTAPAVRGRRLDDREDRLTYLPHRAAWASQEAELARRADTPRRCDLRVVQASAAGVRLAHLPTA